MDDGVQQLPTDTERQSVLVGNTSSSDVIDTLTTAVSTQEAAAGALVGGGALRSGSPWLWAPHVAIGALLLVLMAASFVRFHCKYGHKYRTGSQSFSSTLRLAPKTAWTLDKKTSATALPRSRSGHVTSMGGASSSHHNQTRRSAARAAAVIVLKPVGGGGVDHGGLSRRSVVSVEDSSTTIDEVAGQGQCPPRTALTNTSGGSTISVDCGKMADSTTLDMDLMTTSRGSDEDWAALALHAPAAAADPWSAIQHRHQNTAAATTLTTTAVVDHHQGPRDDQQLTQVDWSGAGATLKSESSSCWWPSSEASGVTPPTRIMSDMFPSLGVFRHHQTTLQAGTGVPDDRERLIDDASDRPIL